MEFTEKEQKAIRYLYGLGTVGKYTDRNELKAEAGLSDLEYESLMSQLSESGYVHVAKVDDGIPFTAVRAKTKMAPLIVALNNPKPPQPTNKVNLWGDRAMSITWIAVVVAVALFVAWLVGVAADFQSLLR